MPGKLAALLLALGGLLSALAGRAQEVGEVARVREALGIEGQRTWVLAEKDAVRVGLTAALREPRSYIRLSLDDRITAAAQGAKLTAWGSFDFKGVGEFTVEKAEAPEREPTTGRFLLGLLVPRGKLWMALRQAVAHTVSVLTPQLTAISGTTSFRMLVDPVAGTFLATDEGEVRAELPTGEVFRVTAGHWLLVPPKGTIQRGANDHLPDSLEDPPLLDCCDFRTGPQIP